MKITEFRKLIREEIRKVINEGATPKSGQKIDDWDLVDKGYISEDHTDYWLDLLADERIQDGWIDNPAQKSKVLKLANSWLKKNDYTWQVADALDQNEEGEVTWVIK